MLQKSPEAAERAAVAREIIDDDPQRDIASRAEVSQTTVHNWLRGDRLKYDIVVQLAEGLGVTGELRRRLFASQKYPDPGIAELVYIPELSGTLETLGGLRDLSREDIAIVEEELRKLIAEKRKARGLE